MATALRPSTSATTFTIFNRELEASDLRDDVKLSNPATSLSGRHLPYWLVNVPYLRWPAECPSFLRDICEKNKQILSTPDEQYKRQDWELVKELISE
jgi:hypothetical protein